VRVLDKGVQRADTASIQALPSAASPRSNLNTQLPPNAWPNRRNGILSRTVAQARKALWMGWTCGWLLENSNGKRSLIIFHCSFSGSGIQQIFLYQDRGRFIPLFHVRNSYCPFKSPPSPPHPNVRPPSPAS
jgi:hypothetical protein